MVHIKDDGVFDAPVDKIWRFLQAGQDQHKHKAMKSSKILEKTEKGMTVEAERVNPDGSTRMETIKFTFDPPKGFTMEWVSGAMKGSKNTLTYTPMGNKTKVEVEGDFYFQGADDNTIRTQALKNLAEVFDEDTAGLRNFK